MALTLDQRRAMKQSLAEGDVQGAQELWQGMQDELTRFVGQPRMVTQPRAASKALVEPTSPIGAAKPRWKSDDLLRLPARVVSGVNEPMQRYPLPRKHTLREGAVAHLGGGTPAAISPSIHAEAGKMAIERRVESEGPQPEATSSALALASDLGWTVGSRLGQSGSPTAASTRSRSESFFAETQSSPLLLTGPAGGHGGRAGGGGSGRTSPTGGGEEGGAGSRPGSRERRRSHTRKSLSTASRTHGTNTTGASGASSRRSRHAAPPVVLKPTRREIATGMALPVPQAKFDLDSVVVEVERVELPPPEPSNAGTLRADASYSSSAAQSTTADWGMAGLDSDAAAADAAEEMLRSLREQQVRFEKEQRYMEADAARRRFEQVFADEVTRRQDVLSSRQHAQRLGAEEAYELEWRQLRALWDAKIGAFDEKVRNQETDLRARQEAEMSALVAKLASHPAARPATRELLELRQRQAMHARRGTYESAAEANRVATAVEAEQSQKLWTEHRTQAVLVQKQQRARHANESRVLTQRIERGREELRVARDADFERLERRYLNVCNELRAQQKGEQRRYDRAAKLRSERLGIELKPAARAPSPPPSGPTSRVMISPSVTA